MPVIIRRTVSQRFEKYAEIASNSWDLRTEIEALEEWLIANARSLDTSFEWIADVGFTVRLDALLVASLGQGCNKSELSLPNLNPLRFDTPVRRIGKR